MAEYNVVLIYEENKRETHNRIMLHSQRDLPFDIGGNADGWRFSEENIPYIGDVLVLKTPHEEIAKIAHKSFGKLEGIIVPPLTVT